MGPLSNAGFAGPDGGDYEVVWAKPGPSVETGLRRGEWATVEII